MGEEVGKVSVVGKKKQSFCINVEATHRINPLLYSLQKIHDGRSILGISYGCEVSAWLIEKEGHIRFESDESLSIDLDVVFQGICFETERVDHLAINGHSSFENHSFRFSPRSDPSPRQNLLNSLQSQGHTSPFRLGGRSLSYRRNLCFWVGHCFDSRKGLNLFQAGEVGKSVQAKQLQKGLCCP